MVAGLLVLRRSGSPFRAHERSSVYVRLVVTLLVWTAFIGALIFGAAGTLNWPAGWAYLFLSYGLGLPISVTLGRHDPELLRARLGGPFAQGQPGWDKVLLPVIMLVYLGWLGLMPLDAVRFRLSHVPVFLQCLGGLCLACAMWWIHLTLRENPYAAPVVKVQRERGHHVVDTGPYAVVRHPMYAIGTLYFLSAPLLLGSWYGLALVPLLTALFAVRAVLEERTLMRELPGYAEYAVRVRYRFLPLVW